jgi:enterochelin esterase-like enzyme
LHGGFGYQTDGGRIALEPFVAAMNAVKMPETIIVVPQALPSGWYANSKDGARPIEDVLIQNLVPHIDANYRTIASPKARGIEGMSMGGYGALRLGLKYPEVFGVISAVAPSITEKLSDEPEIRTAETFFGDQDYFEATGPWGIAKSNMTAILKANPAIRILGGSLDGLEPVIKKFNQILNGLGISYEFIEVEGVGHDYTDILGKSPVEPYLFWEIEFGKVISST